MGGGGDWSLPQPLPLRGAWQQFSAFVSSFDNQLSSISNGLKITSNTSQNSSQSYVQSFCDVQQCYFSHNQLQSFSGLHQPGRSTNHKQLQYLSLVLINLTWVISLFQSTSYKASSPDPQPSVLQSSHACQFQGPCHLARMETCI